VENWGGERDGDEAGRSQNVGARNSYAGVVTCNVRR
jgi:hypothetical protein